MDKRKIFGVTILLGLLVWLYSGFSSGTSEVLKYKLKGYRAFTTEHFTILSRGGDPCDIPLVASTAERAYGDVVESFGQQPSGRIPIIVFPDSLSLQRAFKWPSHESNLGVYHRGTIYIQSPSYWIGQSDSPSEEFYRRGPLVHELTHLMVDRLTLGNYPRWFTEGIAQYVERDVTGYTLEEDFQIDMCSEYTTEEIFEDFDDLEDVPRAYLQALEMTTQLAGGRGLDAIVDLLPMLRSGEDIDEIYLRRVG